MWEAVLGFFGKLFGRNGYRRQRADFSVITDRYETMTQTLERHLKRTDERLSAQDKQISEIREREVECERMRTIDADRITDLERKLAAME